MALIPLEKLFSGKDGILIYREKSSSSREQPKDPFDTVLEDSQVVTLPQRCPGPDDPHRKIPPSEWPTILRRIEQNKETLRQVARDYGVSYEAVRRVVRAARKQAQTG